MRIAITAGLGARSETTIDGLAERARVSRRPSSCGDPRWDEEPMTRFTILISIAVIAWFLVACGDDSTASPSPTALATSRPTSTSTTAVPTATARPALPGDISQAIEAAQAADSARLESLLTRTKGPCVANPAPAIRRPPACPPGSPAGTLVPAVVIGGCPDEPSYIDPPITYRITGFDARMYANHVIGIVDLGSQPLRYAALFGAEKAAWLGFDDAGRLIGAGGGGDCPSDALRPRLSGAKWLVGPDWGD
jgi:hypothetical protein